MFNHIRSTYFLCLTALVLASCENSGAPPTPPATANATNPAAKPAPAKPSELAKSSEPAKPELTKPEAPKADAPKTDAPAAAPAAPASSGDAAIDTMRAFIASKKIDKTVSGWKTKVTEPPKLTFDPAHKYFWVLETSEGTIKLRFKPELAPMHVSSAIYLTELGFYDDLNFHRVFPGFMAQGGDPLGNGRGGPGYRLMAETSPIAKHDKIGVLSTANSGQPKSDGSQFFIMFAPRPQLDGGYTVFGETVEGFETLKKLESFGRPDPEPPTKLLKIVSAKITLE